MPKTLDDKVVSIEFDNKKFEKNAKETMSTIDKLKAKLRFNKENRMSDDINKEIENVDLSPMETALRKFDLKCSAFEIARITGIQRIVNAAISAGANIARQLTTVPVNTGFAEYEEKMGSVQTIMAGTGESLEKVMDALEKLNVYADKTIYSFSDMTSNIGKFTNAGVKLQDAVDAIRGVSNVAAVSGANTNEASRAMYNLAQSLSAGYVKFIDWKSIENANMATVEFKDNLLETAAAQGSLKKVSKGVYKTLKGNTVTATKNFNETLHEQWLTTDALIKTLRDYADETTEIGKKAYAAAQDVKTLSMLFDTLKEAVQSGWGITWELIIGDFEEAKEFFAQISDSFGNLIGKLSDARNYLLMGGLSKQSNNWKKITNAVNNASISTDDFNAALVETGKLYVANLDEIISKSGSFEASLSQGWLDSGIITKTFKKFNESINNNLGNYTEEQKKIIQELYKQSEEKGSIVNNLISNMDKYGKTSGRELLLSGVINMFTAAIRFVRSISAGINSAFGKVNSKNIYELASRFNKFTQSLILSDDAFDKIARTVRGAANAFKFVGNIIKTGLTFALKTVCSLLGVAGNTLLDLTANLGDWVSKTVGSIKANEALKELLSTISTIIKVIVALLSSLFSAIRKNQKITRGFNKILTFFSNLLKDVAEFLTAGVVGVADWINEVKKLDGFTFDNLMKAFELLDEKVFSYLFGLDGAFGRTKAVIAKIKEALNGIWTGFIEDFKSKYTAVYDALKQVYDWIKSFITKKVKKAKEFDASENKGGILAAIFGISISALLIQTLRKIGSAVKVAKDLVSGFTDVAGEMGLAIQRLSKGLTRYFNASAFVKLAISIAILTASLIALAFVPYDKLEAALPILAKLSAIFVGLNILMAVVNKLGGSSSAHGGLLATLFAIILFVKNIATITEQLDKLSALVEKWIQPIEEAGDGLEALKIFAKQLAKIGVVIALAVGAVELFKIFMKALYATKEVSLKGAIGVTAMLLACSLFINKFIPMIKEMYKGLLGFAEDLLTLLDYTFVGKTTGEKVGIVGVLVIIIGGLISSLIVLNKLLSKAAKELKPAITMMLNITFSLVALWAAVKLWSAIDFEKDWPAVATVFGALIVVSGVIVGIGKLLDGSKDFPKIGKALFSLSASLFLIISAIALISFMMKNYKSATWSAVGAVGAIIAALAGFSLAAKNADFSGISSSILKIGIGIALVAGLLIWLSYVLNSENSEAILSIAKWAGIVAVAIAGILGVVSIIKNFTKKAEEIKDVKKDSSSRTTTKNKNVSKKYEGVYQTILAFASLVAEIAGIIYLFATNIKGKEAWARVGLATAMILAVVAAVAFCLRQITKIGYNASGKKAETNVGFTTKSVAALISVMAALGYLVSMIIPIADLPTDKIISAGSVIAGITLAVGGMVLMFSSLGSSGKKAKNISGTMLAGLIVTLVAISGMIAMIIPISKSPVDQIIASGAVIAAVALSIGILTKFVYSTFKTAGTITKNKLVSIAILLGGMAVIIATLAALSHNDSESILATASTMLFILGEITAIYISLGLLTKKGGTLSTKSFSEIATSFILMSVAIAIISASLGIAAGFDAGRIEQAGTSITTIVAVLAIILGIFSQISFDKASIMASATGFAIMAAGVLIIAGALTTLTAIGKTDGVVKAGEALALVIWAVALCIALFSLLEKGQMILGAISFDIMTIGILVIASALEKLSEIDSSTMWSAVGAISAIVVAMSAISIAIGAIEAGTAGIGALAFAAGVASLYSVAGAILLIAVAIEKVANSYEKLQNATAMLPVLVKAFKAELSELIGNASEKAATAYENGKAIIDGFSEGVKVRIIEAMPSIYETISNAFVGVSDMVSEEIDALLEKISKKNTSFKITGAYLMAGMRQGLSDMEQPVYDNMARIGDNTIKTLNKTCEIRSPSKRTTETGEYLSQGLYEGMENQQQSVYLGGFASGIAALAGFSDAASLSTEVGTKTFDIAGPNKSTSTSLVLSSIFGSKSSSSFSFGNLKTIISDAMSSLGLDNIFGSSSSTSQNETYSKKYYAASDDTRQKWDSAAKNVNNIIDNFKDQTTYWRGGKIILMPTEYEKTKDVSVRKKTVTKDDLINAIKEAYSVYSSSGSSNSAQLNTISKINSTLSTFGLNVSDTNKIIEFWKLTGSAIPYELIESLDTIDSSGKKLDSEIIPDEFDITKYFESILDANSEANKTAKDILDSTDTTNKILGSGTSSEKSYTFVQNNYSPKALSSVEIYRQTNNQLSKLARKGW